jgi:hypothetical protein
MDSECSQLPDRTVQEIMGHDVTGSLELFCTPF